MPLTRVSFWGGVATLLSFPMVIFPKLNQTGVAKAAKDEAQRWLDDSNKAFDAANMPYQNALLNLTTVQQQITDATCFVSNYNDFNSSIKAFCQPKLTTNSLYDLTAAYGIDIVSKPPTVTTTQSSRQNDNNGVQRNCDDGRRFNCYSVTTVRHSIYGVSITGSGSNLLINCGLYKNGIIVRSAEFVKSSAAAPTSDNYNELITDTYASTGNVDVFVDAVVKSDKYQIDPYTVIYQGVAAFLLSVISHQCDVLQAAIKSPNNYLDIIAANKDILPEINAEIERLLGPYRNATAYKQSRQDIFDIKSREYDDIHLLTLFSFFLPVGTTMLLTSYETTAKESRYAGYRTCGADLNSLCSWAYNAYKTRTTRQPAQRGVVYSKLASQQALSNDADTSETELTVLRVGESHESTVRPAAKKEGPRLDVV